MKFCLIIPTYNGGEIWKSCVSSIVHQSVKANKILVIDSSSSDSTVEIAKTNNFEVVSIKSAEFNHGGTRNLSLNYMDDDILVFLTQDAVLSSPDSLLNILNVFSDQSVSAVCGRQIPHDDANPIAIHARQFNYPPVTNYKTVADIDSLGIKAPFMSNSFAAYRRSVFKELGGFPSNTILAEDMFLAARMLLNGYTVVYSAEALVKHSHNYTPIEEFRRYFDTGVFHANEPWIQNRFGGASGEGFRFIKSEFLFLLKCAPTWIPRAFFTTLCKYLGYKLGLNYKKLPKSIRFKFSMYKNYWFQQ